jgi:hypothetical protein
VRYTERKVFYRVAFKRKLHHWFRIIRAVKVWQLLLLLVLLGLASAFLLRQNNLGMVELREAVKKADKEDGDVKKALLNLQHYVSAHMNTDLGDGVALQDSYKRAYDAAVQKAVDTSNPNSKIYEQVELECRPVFQRTNSFPAYTECAREKLSTLAPGQDAINDLHLPPAELFRYNYTSPLWSPDAAGITLLLTGVVALVLVARMVSYLILRAILRTHQ